MDTTVVEIYIAISSPIVASVTDPRLCTSFLLVYVST
jgi:hypothetical protein